MVNSTLLIQIFMIDIELEYKIKTSPSNGITKVSYTNYYMATLFDENIKQLLFLLEFFLLFKK